MRGSRRPWTSAAAVVAAGALLAGCSGAADTEDAQPAAAEEDGPRIIQPGAPGEPSREVDPSELAELDFSSYNDADVAFMQGMIPHHVQALRMTRLVPTRTSREDIPLFAERMDISQDDEITFMREWLEERDEEVPSLLAGHEHGGEYGEHDGELMPGMLTEEQLAELEAAEGEEFDRLFLTFMLQHHMGALWMVQQLFDNDGAQDPQLSQFANHIYSDQEIEITRIYSMLDDLGVDLAELELPQFGPAPTDDEG